MPGARVLKRRKTPLACEFCRRHKIKCDGIHPICGTCSRRGRARDQCVWKHIDGRLESVPESNTFVHQLEQRIQQLESRAWSNSQLAQPTTETIAHGPSQVLASPAAAGLSEESPGGISISAMEGAVTNAPQSEGYIGSASAACFMNLIRRAVDHGSAVSGQIQNVNTPPTRDTTSSALRKPSMPYVLPPRRDAERLVIAYWDYIHPLYPFLYQPCFANIFVGLWAGKLSLSEAPSPLMRTTEANSVCLVNLVLALACQYYDVPVDRQDLTEGPKSGIIFFNRARSIFQYDVSDGTDQSLQVVQIFLLMAQYLNSTGSPQRSWEVIGAAIRICQRLGLHRGAATDQRVLPDPVEREMIKRVWHGCLMMERMLCATLGRPTMVTAAESDPVPFPEELDEGAFQSGRQTLTYAPMSTLSFFVSSAKLFKMVHLILLAFYSEDANGARDYNHYFTGPTSIFDIDSQMTEWLAAIPDYIRLESYNLLMTEEPGHTQVFRRQAVVLRIRFLQARIFLFRPVLAKMCVEARGMDSQHAGSLAHRTALQCSVLCVKAAIEIIEVVNNHQTTASAWGHKPSWLYVVLHIYLAATVLLAARLSPIVLLGEISKQEIQESWNHALDILDRFQADNLSAKRCVAALKVLYQRLPGGADAQEQKEDGLDSSGTANLQGDAVVIGPADELFPQQHPTLAGPPDDEFGQELGSEWMPDFDFSNPYDMTWFQVTDPGLYTL